MAPQDESRPYRVCPKCRRHYDDLRVARCPEDGAKLLLVSPDPTLTGEVIDERYEVRGKLGQGGMGVVYKAFDRNVGREVAIKLLRPEMVATEDALLRFSLEVAAVAKLESQHSVRILDQGQTSDGRAFYTMELLRGETLGEVLEREVRLNPMRAVHIARQICRSLKDAHERGVVHRDLKPDNVFLVEEADTEVIKVLDFGIAILANTGQRLTKEGMLCGTPEYMAPERIGGERGDARSDVYALGCLVYEMVSGAPPFLGQSITEVMTLQRHQEPIPLERSRSGLGVPFQLGRLVMRMLRKAPQERPQSMAAVIEELSDIHSELQTVDMPLSSLSIGTDPYMDESLERHASVTHGATRDAVERLPEALPLVLVGVEPEPAAVPLLDLDDDPENLPTEVLPTRVKPAVDGRPLWLWALAGAVAVLLGAGVAWWVADDAQSPAGPTVTTSRTEGASPGVSASPGPVVPDTLPSKGEPTRPEIEAVAPPAAVITARHSEPAEPRKQRRTGAVAHTVLVTVRSGVAQVSEGDKALGETPFKCVLIGEAARKLVVSRKGYVAREVELTTDSDEAIVVSLTRKPRAKDWRTLQD